MIATSLIILVSTISSVDAYSNLNGLRKLTSLEMSGSKKKVSKYIEDSQFIYLLIK